MAICYKFRTFDENGLRVLRDRAFYCASPDTLNDPLDCQLDVNSAVAAAVARMSGENAQIMNQILTFSAIKKDTEEKLTLHDAFTDFQGKIGIFSLSRNPSDMLLWSHYGNGHKGFCIGFDEEFLALLLKEYKRYQIIGIDKFAINRLPSRLPKSF